MAEGRHIGRLFHRGFLFGEGFRWVSGLLLFREMCTIVGAYYAAYILQVGYDNNENSTIIVIISFAIQQGTAS